MSTEDQTFKIVEEDGGFVVYEGSKAVSIPMTREQVTAFCAKAVRDLEEQRQASKERT